MIGFIFLLALIALSSFVLGAAFWQWFLGFSSTEIMPDRLTRIIGYLGTIKSIDDFETVTIEFYSDGSGGVDANHRTIITWNKEHDALYEIEKYVIRRVKEIQE